MTLTRALPLIGYLVLAGGVAASFAVYGAQRQGFRRDVCRAIVDERKTLAGLIGQAVPPVQPANPALPPSIRQLIEENQRRTQAFLDDAQHRLARPIPACTDTGIDTTVTVHGATTPPPVEVGASTSTTVTTRAARSRTAPTRPGGGARHAPSTRRAAGSSPSTTRPASPSTTTTRPCRPDPVGVVVDGRCVP